MASVFFSNLRGGHERRNVLMNSNPYSNETSIITHEEVLGGQTQLHLGFTLGKLVQPSLGISIVEIPTLFCPNSLNDVLQNFLIGQWT